MSTVIGFFSIYFILGILFLLMKGSSKILNGIGTVLSKGKTTFCAVMFTFVSFLFTLFYILVAITTGNSFFSALVCAIFLVFSWCMDEFFYRLIAGEKGCMDETLKALSKEDKNVCNLFALIGVVISSAVLCYEEKNFEYVILISVAISIWMGAYIPISEIYKGTPIKELIFIIRREFKCQKKSVKISSFLCVFIVTILALKNEVAIKMNSIIEDFGVGLVMGSLVLVFVVVIVGICRKRTKK